MVEDRLVVVVASDHRDLVRGARRDHAPVVELGSEAFGVDGRDGVTDALPASPSVAFADDRDQLAGLLVVVGCDELDQRLLG